MELKRQAAFTGGRLLKGGLHCHTTRSDGEGEPAEVLRLHKAYGYDFLAVTDHRCFNYGNFGVEGLTVIPGMEMDANFPAEWRERHCHHIVCLAAPGACAYAQDQTFDRVYIKRPEETQAMLDALHAAGCMTMYCHPEWSGTPAGEFAMLKGNFAMEVWNSGCAMENGIDRNAAYWDELLASGQHIFGAATDDGHPMAQHGHGWVMVNAENSAPAILRALRVGAFYASCGPVIRDFYVKDGIAVLDCEPAAEIQFRNLRVPYRITRGDGLTHAEVEVRSGDYIRAVVRDAQGRRAWTNPIWLSPEDVKPQA